MNLLRDKRTRTLIIIMSVLVAIAYFVAKNYYKGMNESIDPRIVPARKLYAEYNDLAGTNDFEAIFLLMDSIETIYERYPHYKNSYEVGVLSNNRAAALLTMALHKDSIVIRSKYFDALSADTLLIMAEMAVRKSIHQYEIWLEKFRDKSEEEIYQILHGEFNIGLENYEEGEKDLFLDSRISEIQTAQYENLRRLSVSYTNLGIIFRNLMKYEEAVLEYRKAIDLWDRNLVAKNNLNILLGLPLEKRNIIQKLFPPEREDKEK